MEFLTSKTLVFAFSLKFIFAILLWAIYTYYYTDRSNADIYKYFDDAVYLFRATESNLSLRWEIISGLYNKELTNTLFAQTQFWDSQETFFFNDNRSMIRIHLILLHISRGFYQIHTLFFVLLSLIGSIGLFRFLHHYSKIQERFLILISFFIPSILFWASAPLKESFLLFSLGLFLAGITSLQKELNLKSALLLVMGFLGLLSLKIYILFCVLPAALFIGFSKGLSLKKSSIYFLVLHFLTVLLIFFKQDLIVSSLARRQSVFNELVQKVGPNSSVRLNSYDSFSELILTIPQAIFNVIIKPVWPPNWNPFTLATSLEHFFYLILVGLPFFFPRSLSNSEKKLVLFSSSFVLISTCLIGLTTPVLGAIVRYKTPLIPFYLILILSFVDFTKITQKFK